MELFLLSAPKLPHSFWISSVLLALQTFSQTSFNILTDSFCVINIIQKLPNSILNTSIDKPWLSPFVSIQTHLTKWQHPFLQLIFKDTHNYLELIRFWESTSWFICWPYRIIVSVQFGCSVISDSLWPHVFSIATWEDPEIRISTNHPTIIGEEWVSPPSSLPVNTSDSPWTINGSHLPFCITNSTNAQVCSYTNTHWYTNNIIRTSQNKISNLYH